MGAPFKFHTVVVARWDATLSTSTPTPTQRGAGGEQNSMFKVEMLGNDNLVVDRVSPRDNPWVRRVHPQHRQRVVRQLVLFTPDAVPGEALFYISSAFDMMDATFPKGSKQQRSEGASTGAGVTISVLCATPR